MNPDRFVKVFDVLDSGFRDWSFPAFGLIFIVVGIVIAVFPIIIKATGIPSIDVTRPRRFRRYAVLLFAVMWTTFAFFLTYSQHSKHKTLAKADGCRVVEGPVEHFVPMPYGGHSQESFSVSGIPFKYSDFMVTDAFNNTSSHGGPINANSYVRICYDPSDNAILRLEIRDFNEKPKDYSRAAGIFSDLQVAKRLNGKNDPANVPWYGNLIVVLGLLDFVAIQTLFIPYLRTFFRIKTAPVEDLPIPQTLEPGKKVKLRNSMIYWERENRVIWLRPRGFNLMRMPLMVAKPNADAYDQSIVGYEIRFSSGFPALIALVLLTFSSIVSASVAGSAGANAPPLPILAIFGGLIVLIGFLNFRVLRSRMEELVQDGLSELKDMRSSGPWG